MKTLTSMKSGLSRHVPKLGNHDYEKSAGRKKLILLLAFSICAIAANAQLTLQLVPSDYNGVNISCFGGRNGSIDLTVTGGAAPFSFTWSNGATTEDITDVAAGYYHVQVQDANFELAGAEITLTEPLAIGLRFSPYYYSNGYNISQYGACNGSVDVLLTGGTAPFTFLWTPGLQTIEEPTNLCAGDHSLEVTDANGCTAHQGQPISQPDRSDWQITGNSGTNPSSQFIGTTDNKDLVFKANSNEAIRIKANGNLKINSFTGGVGSKLLLSDSLGNIFSRQIIFPAGCNDPSTFAWQEKAATPYNITYTCSHMVGIGTDDPQDNLGVKGSARFFNGQNPTEYIAIGHNSNNPYIKTVGAYGLLINYDNGKEVKICTGSAVNRASTEIGGDVYLATVNGASGKKVGIGTSNPAGDAKLHVVGDAIFTQYDAPFTYAPKIRGTDGVSSASLPDFTWAGDDVTGIFHPGSSVIGFSVGSSEKMRIHSNGYVGIGTVNPAGNLEVKSNGDTRLYVTRDGSTYPASINLKNDVGNWHISGPRSLAGESNCLGIYWNVGANYARYFTINDEGKVGIGTTDMPNGYKLFVKEGILTEKVLVAQQGGTLWPDYVFKDNYELKTLSEIDAFIKNNGHLPEIPSASEIECNGIDLAEMQKLQMKKIEELTLYVIRLNQENEKLKTQINSLIK